MVPLVGPPVHARIRQAAVGERSTRKKGRREGRGKRWRGREVREGVRTKRWTLLTEGDEKDGKVKKGSVCIR